MLDSTAVPTLSRYVARRFASAFAGALLALGLVVLVVDLLLHVSTLFGEESGALRLLGLRLGALFLPWLLPLATFVGAYVAVGLLARSRELLAVRAAGIAPLRVLAPVFLLSAGVALATFALQETVTVRATAALAQLEGHDDFYRRAGSAWYGAGPVIYHVRSPEAGAQDLRDVRVFERDERGRLVRIVDAGHAERLAQGRWRFESATVRAFDPALPDRPPRVEHFEEVELALAPDRPERIQGDLRAVPVWTLAGWQTGEQEAARVRGVLHQRLTGPLVVLLTALLGVLLGLRVEHTRSLARPAAEGAALLFVVFAAREYGPQIASGALASVLVPWLTLLLFATLAGVGLARAER